jgi:radical SAM protein
VNHEAGPDNPAAQTPVGPVPARPGGPSGGHPGSHPGRPSGHPGGHPGPQSLHPGHPAVPAARVDYAKRPMLVFWETTRACGLACKHCRASATLQALPGELDTAEGRALIDQVAGFGRPYPILVLTGGDCLLRPDLWELVEYAQGLGIPTALSPSVTPALTDEAIAQIASSGVKAVSISLDGATAATHDGVRGIEGLFDKTLEAIRKLVAAGLTVQINTTVMRANVDELSDVAALMAELGVHIWEVFFLVHVGRGVAEGALTAQEHEDVAHLLWEASHYGYVVRTVEAPFFRRVVAQRRAGGPVPDTELYRRLAARLVELLGAATGTPSAHTAATRDGKGILFVAHDGQVHPAGFLPLELGSVRDHGLADLYRNHPVLVGVRGAEFGGRCGRCPYSDLCGGSRARAYAATGDPLAEDPACAYEPPAQPAPAVEDAVTA